MIESFIVEPLVALWAVLGIFVWGGVGMMLLMAPIAVLTRATRAGKGNPTVGLLVVLGIAFWLAILLAAPVLAL